MLLGAAMLLLTAGLSAAQQMMQQAPQIQPVPAPTPAPPQAAPPPAEYPMQSQPAPPAQTPLPPPRATLPMMIPPNQPLPSVFRGCWQGTVAQLDYIQRLPGAHKVGYWTPKTYRLCYKRVGDGPYQLTFGETGVVPTEKIAYSKGRVEVLKTDGRSAARIRSFLHFDEYFAGSGPGGATFAVDEVTLLDCAIEQDRMRVSAQVTGRREDQPWFRAHWHTDFLHSPQ